MLKPDTLATISVCGAVVLMTLIAWRQWVHLRHRVPSSAEPPAWQHWGPEEIWDVCDTWRDAEFGIAYLKPVIARLDGTSRTIDIIIAASTASSVSSLALFQDVSWGVYIWKCLAGIGGLLAVIKPFLQLQGAIKNRQELLKAYTVLSAECEKVIDIIRSIKACDQMTRNLYDKAKERFQVATSASTMESAEIKNLSEEKRKLLMDKVENRFTPILRTLSNLTFAPVTSKDVHEASAMALMK